MDNTPTIEQMIDFIDSEIKSTEMSAEFEMLSCAPNEIIDKSMEHLKLLQAIAETLRGIERINHDICIVIDCCAEPDYSYDTGFIIRDLRPPPWWEYSDVTNAVESLIRYTKRWELPQPPQDNSNDK